MSLAEEPVKDFFFGFYIIPKIRSYQYNLRIHQTDIVFQFHVTNFTLKKCQIKFTPFSSNMIFHFSIPSPVEANSARCVHSLRWFFRVLVLFNLLLLNVGPFRWLTRLRARKWATQIFAENSKFSASRNTLVPSWVDVQHTVGSSVEKMSKFLIF